MGYKVNWTPALKKKVIKRITEYLEDHGTGECISQSDSANIEATFMMPEIGDYEGLVTYIEDED